MLFDPDAIMQSYITGTAPLEDMLFVKGKTAIVTGGSSGLGFCVAQRLLQGGANVVISSSNPERGEKALELLHEAGYEKVIYQKADLRSEEEIAKLVTDTAAHFGSVDILVTAGGVWSFAHIQDLPEEEFLRILDINLMGTYRCAKYVTRYMVEHNVKGKLVLVSSNSAFLPQPVFGGYAHYTASKGGVISMTTEIAKEMKRYGIMVNTVAPGGMWTPGCLSNGPVSSLTPEKQAEIGREMMVAKLDYTPEADSVAVVVYALCTRLADGVTGECVVADSGMMRNIVSYQPAIEQFPAE